MLLAVLVAQEELLVLIPNVSLTPLLIVLYAAILPFHLLVLLIMSYVLLDSMFMGTLDLMYMIPMVLAWVTLGIFGRIWKDKFITVTLFTFFFGFLYGWFFIPTKMIMLDVFHVWPYLLSDLPFEVIMAISNLILMVVLYRPLKKVLTRLIRRDFS